MKNKTSYTEHTDKPKPGTDRAFGLVFAALFGIVAFYPAFHSGGNIRLWALGLAVGFACAAALCPAILAPRTSSALFALAQQEYLLLN